MLMIGGRQPAGLNDEEEPAMSKLRPALAYTAPSDREGADDYLVSHGFFRWDDSTETEDDLGRTPDERPVLCRKLAWAEVTDAEAVGLEQTTPSAWGVHRREPSRCWDSMCPGGRPWWD